MTARKALERAHEIWAGAIDNPAWNPEQHIARTLLDERIEALKWALGHVGLPLAYKGAFGGEIVRLRTERKKLA